MRYQAALLPDRAEAEEWDVAAPPGGCNRRDRSLKNNRTWKSMPFKTLIFCGRFLGAKAFFCKLSVAELGAQHLQRRQRLGKGSAQAGDFGFGVGTSPASRASGKAGRGG